MTARLLAIAMVGLLVSVGGPRIGAQAEPEQSTGAQPAKTDDKRLVYADFENSTDGKPISSRGGEVRLYAWQENPAMMSAFKGQEGDNSIPMLVRTSKTDQNHAAAFEWELRVPNQWAGVTMEINGHAGTAGALPADDVSGYKHLNVSVYGKGTSYVRVEIKSQGREINPHSGYPVTGFKLKDGFNTYQIPLRNFSQPSWVTDTRIDPKDVLKQLTSIAVSVYCDECRPMSGLLIVDNLVFEK
jgi:hypothetical protein